MDSYSNVGTLNNIWKRLRTDVKRDACVWSIFVYDHAEHDETVILRNDILEPNWIWFNKNFPSTGTEHIELLENTIMVVPASSYNKEGAQNCTIEIVFQNLQHAANFSQLLHERRADLKHEK